MLWNWNTVNTCFIARSWQITSTGMFAGSCIGVLLLTMSLEFLRRTVKEYDRFLVRKHALAAAASAVANDTKGGVPSSCHTGAFRPTFLEQAVRAFLHMVQFAVAYFVMLLAMYYNGYFIICIFIGAYLGAFVFHWEPIGGNNAVGQTSATREPTVCCA
ncbi:hypothetical protein HGRIS_005328 [Hohenbuehelia grisea]|uniref:Copper transport protein n=1 Tax=Hohenbuehelia grisea TaxID=104357 RepID=A0ABR3JEP0_9AGAR